MNLIYLTNSIYSIQSKQTDIFQESLDTSNAEGMKPMCGIRLSVVVLEALQSTPPWYPCS